MISYVAWTLGLLPLLWLALLRARGVRRDVAWWWLAGAFAVSWVADACALAGVEPWLVSLAYPVSQSAIIGSVLLDRDEAFTLVQVLAMAAVGAVLWRDVAGPDVLLHTVAWLAVVGIVLDRPALGRLRIALLIYFGAGWLCWMGYNLRSEFDTWLAYQVARATGIALWCWAVSTPAPRLRVVVRC